MNSQLEECIGSSEFSVNVTYRTPTELERDGISMRNLNGQWIRAVKNQGVADLQPTTSPAVNAAYPGTGPVVIGGTSGVA